MRDLDWQIVPASETAAILAHFNPLIKPQPLAAETTQLRMAAVSFYDGYAIYEITNQQTTPNTTRYGLLKNDDAILLDWSNVPIYALNERAKVIINKNTVAAYAKFFFDFVRGRHGRFVIAEDTQDVAFLASASDTERQAVARQLQPLNYKGIGRDSRFGLEGTVLFKNALFKTNIRVAPDGMVELTDEQLLMEDLNVQQDVVLTRTPTQH